MAAKDTVKEIVNDPLTIVAEEKKEGYNGPRVSIFLPALEDPGDQGLSVDQYEHVTIANEEKEEHYRIHRGEWVEVPVPVYVILKQGKYPKI